MLGEKDLVCVSCGSKKFEHEQDSDGELSCPGMPARLYMPKIEKDLRTIRGRLHSIKLDVEDAIRELDCLIDP